MTKKDIRRAAFWLNDWAVTIRDSCFGTDGVWDGGESAQKMHDEMRALSKKLYAVAREPKQTSLLT